MHTSSPPSAEFQLRDASYATNNLPYDAAIVILILLLRPNSLQWLITITASVLVLGGTLVCVFQIHTQHYQMNVNYYFIHSLLSWSACIMLDGRHILNLWWVYGLTPLGSLRRMGLRRTVCATLDTSWRWWGC